MDKNIHIPFKGWTVIRMIGRGSFGSVYEIHRHVLFFEERAAMKVISIPIYPNEAQNIKRKDSDESSLRMRYESIKDAVLQECSIISKYKNVANVVRCDDIKVEANQNGIGFKVYIRSELLTPLREYAGLNQYNEEEILQLGIDICSTLDICEKEGFVHGDINPDHILVSDHGKYKLDDFGIARRMIHNTQETMRGIKNYVAPEFYLGKDYNHSTDIYSLALVLYMLTNNNRIFSKQGNHCLNPKEIEDVRKKWLSGTPLSPPTNASPRLSSIIMKALEYDPANRYQSAEEFETALRSYKEYLFKMKGAGDAHITKK